MKKLTFLLLCFCGLLFCVVSCEEKDMDYGSGQTVTEPEEPDPEEKDTVVVLAYVTSWTTTIPDPSVLTHINYSFGHVNETFNGITIDNESRLRSIVQLKNQKKSLKILLSVGGWASGHFSEMAANESNRNSFARDCKRVIDEFNLDGIDIDWEFPTSSAAGISSSPRDTENYNLLMQAIRDAIGKNKLLTFASGANGKYYDFKQLADIIDFVNIMLYNVNHPPYHHSALHRSSMVKDFSAEESVDIHIKAGIPKEKLVLGIPFYGIISDPVARDITYSDVIKLEGYAKKWDDIAKVPYLADSSGNLVCTYDNTESIAYKCTYIKEKGLLGAMYWEYAGDDSQSTLRKAVWNGIIEE